MKIKLRYFASIREAVGQSSEHMDTSAVNLAALRDELIARGGPHAQALARGKTLRVAQNQVMAAETASLSDGDEIAFFPPVTGG